MQIITLTGQQALPDSAADLSGLPLQDSRGRATITLYRGRRQADASLLLGMQLVHHARLAWVLLLGAQ